MNEKNNLNIKESLKKVWGHSEKMMTHCLKTSYYLELKDCFVSFDHKPSIDKTIYYNDEYEAPTITKEYFIEHNLRHNFKGLEVDFEKDLYLFANYEQAAEIKYMRELDRFETEGQENLRKVTDEEKALIKAKLAEFKVNYLKRLNAYWKRFSDKVYASGYWANR